MTFSLREKRDFAESMRRNPTQAEWQLWWKLRRNQCGYRFLRQQMLAGFIVDFYCARLKLIIEVDGSVHEIEDQAADDEQRERILENYGYLVLRFTNEDVLDHMPVVLSRIWDECSTRRASLKALDLNCVLKQKGKKPHGGYKGCASVQNLSHPPTVCNSSVDSTPRIPASAEDYAAITTAWRKLVKVSQERSREAFSPVKRRLDLQQQIEEVMSRRGPHPADLELTESQSLAVSKGIIVA